MSAPPDFAEFLRRIRSGDARAAEELVHRYESAIRLAVRTRLSDPALKRQLDSTDVCQSVLRNTGQRILGRAVDAGGRF